MKTYKIKIYLESEKELDDKSIVSALAEFGETVYITIKNTDKVPKKRIKK